MSRLHSFEVVHYRQVCEYVQLTGQESFKVGERRQSPVVIQGFEGLQPQVAVRRRSSMSGKDSQTFKKSIKSINPFN